jgi:hypothetical protein
VSDFFAVSRKLIRDREFWTVERVGAWTILLGMTAWSEHEHTGVQLQAGQFIASQKFLSSRFDWPRKKVRHFLVLLEQRHTIRPVKSTPAGTVYEVVNWSVYQSNRGQARGQARGQEDASTQAVLTGLGAGVGARLGALRKQGLKQYNNYDGSFDRFWERYPKRDGGNPRKAARYAWDARVRDGADPGELVLAAERYAAWAKREGKVGTRYVMRASTFLGPSEHWREDYSPPSTPYRKDWKRVVHLAESKSIRALTREDMLGLSTEARQALEALGGLPHIKSLSEQELKQTGARFYGLCADYSQEVQA